MCACICENCLIFRWFYLMMVPWTAFWCSATNMEYLSLNPYQSFSMSSFLLCHPLNITEISIWKLLSGRTGVSKLRNLACLSLQVKCFGLPSSPYHLAYVLSVVGFALPQQGWVFVTGYIAHHPKMLPLWIFTSKGCWLLCSSVQVDPRASWNWPLSMYSAHFNQ